MFLSKFADPTLRYPASVRVCGFYVWILFLLSKLVSDFLFGKGAGTILGGVTELYIHRRLAMRPAMVLVQFQTLDTTRLPLLSTKSLPKLGTQQPAQCRPEYPIHGTDAG